VQVIVLFGVALCLTHNEENSGVVLYSYTLLNAESVREADIPTARLCSSTEFIIIFIYGSNFRVVVRVDGNLTSTSNSQTGCNTINPSLRGFCRVQVTLSFKCSSRQLSHFCRIMSLYYTKNLSHYSTDNDCQMTVYAI